MVLQQPAVQSSGASVPRTPYVRGEKESADRDEEESTDKEVPLALARASTTPRPRRLAPRRDAARLEADNCAAAGSSTNGSVCAQLPTSISLLLGEEEHPCSGNIEPSRWAGWHRVYAHGAGKRWIQLHDPHSGELVGEGVTWCRTLALGS